jgi:hypothetical protein
VLLHADASASALRTVRFGASSKPRQCSTTASAPISADGSNAIGPALYEPGATFRDVSVDEPLETAGLTSFASTVRSHCVSTVLESASHPAVGMKRSSRA